MTWFVQLSGDLSDLATLAQSLTGADMTISRDGQAYVLSSDGFLASDEAGTVRDRATDLVAIINGAARLALDADQSLAVGSVYRLHADGRRDGFAFPDSVTSRMRASSPTILVTHADGTVEESPPANPVRELTTLAASSDAVATAMRVLALGALDWVNLYRLLEIVAADVGGIDAIARKGWCTKSSMKLLKHTAGSPTAVGLAARHGAATTQPPRRPMTLPEARSLINTLLHAWLRDRP